MTDLPTHLRLWADWIANTPGAVMPEGESPSPIMRQAADLLEAQQWQPIATAPKTGPLVDLWDNRRVPDCFFADDYWWQWNRSDGTRTLVRYPTLWMLPPADPKDQNERG